MRPTYVPWKIDSKNHTKESPVRRSTASSNSIFLLPFDSLFDLPSEGLERRMSRTLQWCTCGVNDQCARIALWWSLISASLWMCSVWIIAISVVLYSSLIRYTVFSRFYNISLHLYYTTDDPKLQYFQWVELHLTMFRSAWSLTI